MLLSGRYRGRPRRTHPLFAWHCTLLFSTLPYRVFTCVWERSRSLAAITILLRIPDRCPIKPTRAEHWLGSGTAADPISSSSVRKRRGCSSRGRIGQPSPTLPAIDQHHRRHAPNFRPDIPASLLTHTMDNSPCCEKPLSCPIGIISQDHAHRQVRWGEYEHTGWQVPAPTRGCSFVSRSGRCRDRPRVGPRPSAGPFSPTGWCEGRRTCRRRGDRGSSGSVERAGDRDD